MDPIDKTIVSSMFDLLYFGQLCVALSKFLLELWLALQFLLELTIVSIDLSMVDN